MATSPQSPKLAIVTRERHGGKKWLRPADFRFAATEALVPVVGGELSSAARALPLAFADGAGHLILAAVLSFDPGRNLFVAPDGRWLGAYIPVAYRAYPFRLLPNDGQGNATLCVDEASGLVVDAAGTGEDFFDQAGNVSASLQRVIELLTRLERDRRTTERAVAALAEAGVIQPWPIAVQSDAGERPVGGLYRIDEAALGGLPDAVFLSLRAASALPVAYAQLLSLGQIAIFAELARVQAPAAAAPLPPSLDRFFGLTGDDDVIHLG